MAVILQIHVPLRLLTEKILEMELEIVTSLNILGESVRLRGVSLFDKGRD